MNEYPLPANALVSARMKRNPKFDTGLEIRLRSELHRRGLRFRTHLAIPISGSKVRPDIVFTRQRLAVFVDGCFWHACPDHGVMPRHNSDYWAAKITRNRQRDAKVNRELACSVWSVMRLWEHIPIVTAADLVVSAVCLKAHKVCEGRSD